jgi:predicted 2-oxoglutarate/Fe(II)-dependent dioxygenase YbiX
MRKELLTERDDIFVIHGFLAADECAEHVARCEAAGFGVAPITTSIGFVVRKDVRDNDRVIIDDVALAGQLWGRAKPFVPAPYRFWGPVGLNERFRFYRYGPGQRFLPHFDGSFARDNGETSRLTFLVYLNEECEGGETVIYLRGGAVRSNTPRLRVKPEVGKALVFVHNILHEGAPVMSGVKYVLRTDVMYR